MRPELKEKLQPKKLFGYALWVLMFFLLAQRIPTWISNYKVEGKVVTPFQVSDETGAKVTLPLPQKQIVVFWATWCKPCELELDRFNRAIADKDIPADSVIAVSLGEEPKLVYDEARRREYAFKVYVDQPAASTASLEVSGTPQVYHIDESGKVVYASMGLSPMSIMRAGWFFGAGILPKISVE
ncbi:MAG: TlpA family protein disulfide reductase [Proteobacteria bacterium]|nr:MAG: TlpA family protein disulfide reductase [Pseudomonadota bacterium]